MAGEEKLPTKRMPSSTSGKATPEKISDNGGTNQ